jgi:uncharacterized protein
MRLAESPPSERNPRSGPYPAVEPYWFLNPLAWCLLLALKIYQKWVPRRHKPECRFVPTCSQYMGLAVRKYGLVAGVRVGWSRFRRCVGFAPSGEDWP